MPNRPFQVPFFTGKRQKLPIDFDFLSPGISYDSGLLEKTGPFVR
jgi:hypothetical protein